MPTEQETKQYAHGKHPNSLANLKKGKRFGNGEGNTLNAREENKKSVAVRNGNKTLREFAIDFADKPMKNGITFKEAYIMRLAKWLPMVTLLLCSILQNSSEKTPATL